MIFVETIQDEGTGHRGESDYKVVRYLILKTGVFPHPIKKTRSIGLSSYTCDIASNVLIAAA